MSGSTRAIVGFVVLGVIAAVVGGAVVLVTREEIGLALLSFGGVLTTVGSVRALLAFLRAARV